MRILEGIAPGRFLRDGQVDVCLRGVIGTYQPLNLNENRSNLTHEKNHSCLPQGYLDGGKQVLKRY